MAFDFQPVISAAAVHMANPAAWTNDNAHLRPLIAPHTSIRMASETKPVPGLNCLIIRFYPGCYQ